MDTILIIEDEEDLLITLEYNLKQEGYRAQACTTGEEGLAWALHHGPPSLVLLDVMLPGISGIEVCQRLRADERTRSTPVLFLSARGEAIDKVVGFELGADDYVAKPFHVRELMLRIRAILRRSTVRKQKSPDAQKVFGKLTMDCKKHRVWIHKKELSLTAMEFKLLDILLTRKGCVLSRGVLLEEVWGVKVAVHTRTVDVHVKRLREKLGPIGKAIETIRNVGYRFREEPP